MCIRDRVYLDPSDDSIDIPIGSDVVASMSSASRGKVCMAATSGISMNVSQPTTIRLIDTGDAENEDYIQYTPELDVATEEEGTMKCLYVGGTLEILTGTGHTPDGTYSGYLSIAFISEGN